jgi:rubrerythrin
MPLRQLKSLYEKRKVMMSNLLDDAKVNKTRKEQLRGAISEIDTLIKTIDSLRQQEIEDNRKIDLKKQIAEMEIPKNIINSISRLKVNFDKSQTHTNLMKLFEEKCLTRNLYEFYAKIAKNECHEPVSRLFTELSEQEKEHAKMIFKMLSMGKKTQENLIDASNNENNYYKNILADYENSAKQERLSEAAQFIHELSLIEAEQEKRILKMIKSMAEKKLYKSEHVARWKCRNCGHYFEGKEAPTRCKFCKQHQGHFEIERE